MFWACGIRDVGDKMYTGFWIEKPEKSEYLEELGEVGRIIQGEHKNTP